MHGMKYGESFLGPLPSPWKFQERRLATGQFECVLEFRNSDTGVVTQNDPRLGELSEAWEKVKAERTRDDPVLFAPHRNKSTGELINSDPRLLPSALHARGVTLETFQII